MANSALVQQVSDLFASQLVEWQQAADNFSALAGVKVKTIDVDGMAVRVQFNPARIVSSSAKVDTKSLKERKCFLCEANRPAVQRGIDWDKYVVLINPFPIFPRHLTIPDRGHVDQLIKGRVADMMRLTAELEGYTVFYNGPKCGASAPDHMHFQAGNSDFLTLAEAIDGAQLETIEVSDKGSLSVVNGLPLNMFVISTADYEYGQELFDRLYAALPQNEGETEPMMNILCYKQGDKVNLVVIPRKRHRPSFYGTEGDDTMLLSPASVDMGGVFITPLEKDFNRVDAEVIKKIYDELCLSNEDVKSIVSKLKK